MLNKIRIICTVLLCAAIMPIISAGAYSDVYEYDGYYNAVHRLGGLGILNGYTDGTFRPSDTLTRAQFAKILTCAMDKEEEAFATGTVTNFHDVAQHYWAAPYINYASKNKLIIGYSDGSFRPEKTITYAEAITVLVRMLGYSEADVGYYWPSNYMEKARNLKITDNFTSIGNNDVINRAVAAVIVDAAIFCEANDESDSPFLKTVGYTVIEDAVILSTSADDTNLPINSVKLSDNSIYESKTPQKLETAMYAGYAVIDENNYLVAVSEGVTGAAASAAMAENGYTMLENCHIIATSSEDRTLSNGEVRTSYGVYETQGSNVSTSVGEVGTVILDKERKIISVGTYDAPKSEYIISEVNDSRIEYVSDNTLSILTLDDSFPIYSSYGARESFADVKDDFVAGAELTMYKSTDDGAWEFGVLDTNAGYSVLNDCFIAATKSEDKSLASDQVRTSGGTYKVKNTEVLSKVGTMGVAVIADNKLEQFASNNMQSVHAVVTRVSGNEVDYTYENGGKGTYYFDNTFVTYVDYEKSTFASAKNNITVGSDISLYGSEYGAWEIAVIDTGADIIPVLASKNYTDNDTKLEGITINKENLTVYRSGTTASLGDIKRNDVVYYNTKTNIMDVYTDKVSGIYYEASPSKAYVNTVTVGGNAYEIGTSEAASKLDASADSYAIGDRVTLLLGKNDKVVFVVELSDFDYFDYGVVVNTYSTIAESGDEKGKSEIHAKVFMPDGEIYDYVTDKDYDILKGKLAKLTFTDGRLSMTTVSENTISGEINKNQRTINGKTVLKDAAIIQLISNEDGQDAELELIDFDTIDADEIRAGQVKNYITANKFGDIGVMFVKGLTDSGYEYAFLKSTGSGENGSTYKLFMNGEDQTIPSERNFSVTAGYPVAVKISGNKITDMVKLISNGSATEIEAVDESRIMLNSTVYTLAPNVAVYSYKNGVYTQITIGMLEDMKTKGVTVYSDKNKSVGASIKAIVVNEK